LQFLNAHHHFTALGKELLVVIHGGLSAHLSKVMTRTKSFARRCNDKCPQLLAFGQIIEFALQGGQHLFAQGVESGWPIQGEGAHAAIVVVPKN
jgi:hypothetical protein